MGHVDISKEEADALIAGQMPMRLKRRFTGHAKSIYTWSLGDLPSVPASQWPDWPAFVPKKLESVGIDMNMNRVLHMVSSMVNEALPPEFAMPDGLSPEGQRAWKIITDFLRRKRLTHSGGHHKVFYSPEEWKAKEGESDGELYIVHDGGEHARAISWEGEDEKTREALQVQLRAAGMFMEQINYVMSGIYKINQTTDPKPREPEPAVPVGEEETMTRTEALTNEALKFLGEEFPPVGANQRLNPRSRLARLRKRRSEDEKGKPTKEALDEGDESHSYEEEDEIELVKSILKHAELLRAAISSDMMLPPGVVQNLDLIKQQAEQLLTMHGVDTAVTVESEDEDEEDDTSIEAHGVRGMNSTPWRKKFKNRKALNAWVEKGDGDIEVYATRKAD